MIPVALAALAFMYAVTFGAPGLLGRTPRSRGKHARPERIRATRRDLRAARQQIEYAEDTTTLDLFRAINARTRLLRSIYDMGCRPTGTYRRDALLLACALNDALTARVQTARHIAAGRYLPRGAR